VYTGPYLFSSVAGSNPAVIIAQTWGHYVSPAYAVYEQNLLLPGQSWTPANDPNGLTFTHQQDRFITVTIPDQPTTKSVTPSSGAISGGQTVTIDGTNFPPDAKVMFGSKEATSVTVLSPKRLLANTPAGKGVVDVTVSTPGGLKSVLSNAFTYTVVPAKMPPPTASPYYAGQAKVVISTYPDGIVDSVTITASDVTGKPLKKLRTCQIAPGASACVVEDLPQGTSYTFVATATNGAGTSVPSDPSNVVSVS
jgi:hypothetical protein